MTYEQLKAALDSFFGDTTRSKEETKDGLERIAEEALMLADTIKVD